MNIKEIFRAGNIVVDIRDADTFKAIEPQQPPTSNRMKELLGRGLTAPSTLTPEEVRELCGSVAYHLLAERFGSAS